MSKSLAGKAFKEAGFKAVTADGVKICFGFNRGSCTIPGCTFAHVCCQCLGSHAYEDNKC